MNITEQALDLADAAPDAEADADVKVAPEAMHSPGLPVPDDPAAIALFTAHRLDDVLHRLGHATERLQAARDSSGDLRKYHSVHVARHLRKALGAARDLTANVREHYPDEAGELEKVPESAGLANAAGEDGKASVTARLLASLDHELTHGSHHAQAMTEAKPGATDWSLNAGHAGIRLGAALSHAGILAAHLRGNYSDVGRWLEGLDRVTAPAEEDGGKRDGETITAQMANTD